MTIPFEHHTANPGRVSGGNALPLRARSRRGRRQAGGFILTFWEVLISVVIVALVFGAIIQGYLVTAVRDEWSGYALAAQSLGIQVVEQARSAGWDIATGKDELTNMILQSASWNAGTKTYSGYTTNIMDLPYKDQNYVIATNYVTIQTISVAPNTNVQMRVVNVITVWPFTGWGKHALIYYTNSICTLLAPDNRDPSTLGVGG